MDRTGAHPNSFVRFPRIAPAPPSFSAEQASLSLLRLNSLVPKSLRRMNPELCCNSITSRLAMDSRTDTHARCVDRTREQMRVHRISSCDGEIACWRGICELGITGRGGLRARSGIDYVGSAAACQCHGDESQFDGIAFSAMPRPAPWFDRARRSHVVKTANSPPLRSSNPLLPEPFSTLHVVYRCALGTPHIRGCLRGQPAAAPSRRVKSQ
jgi:hypothetical protein